MRGRRPAPLAIKIARGDRASRCNYAEPRPPGGALRCPKHIVGHGRTCWRWLVNSIGGSVGVLTAADQATMELVCVLYGRWRDAEQKVAEHGTVIKSPSGFPATSPYVTIASRAIDQLGKLLVECGLTPSSRSRIGVTAPKPKTLAANDPAARFFHRA